MYPGAKQPTNPYQLSNDNDSGGRFGQRNLKLWHKVVGAVVIVLILVLAYFGIQWLRNRHSTPSEPAKQKAQFEKLVRGEYNARLFNGTWISGSEFFYSDAYGNLIIYDCKDGSKTVVINGEEMPIDSQSFGFKFSADRKYLLYATNYQNVFRHSVLAKYFTLNVKTKQVTQITDKYLSLVKWAPEGHGIAYITNDFDIWYRSNPEIDNNDVRVTTSGGASVFNGIADWVYEEEILQSSEAMWFSGDGKKLAFVTFNDTMVPIYTIPFYGNPSSLTFQYPLQFPLHYPKVGRRNPTVQVQVADFTNVESGNIKNITSNYLPPDSVLPEPIISSLTWATNTDFLIIWANRYQNVSSLSMCSTVKNSCEEKFVQKQSNGWIVPHFTPIFDSKGERMIMVFRMDEGGNDMYPQVVLFDFTQQKVAPKALTRGKISVSEIAKWDTKEEIVYFMSTVEGKPEQQQTQFVSSNSQEPNGKYTCLTCDNYKTLDGKQCLYTGSVFSTDASYYAITCAGPDTPEVTIYNMTHKPILRWENNEKLRQVIKSTYIPSYTILDVPLEENFTARVYLNYPEIDESQDKKYPLLIRVYSGPESALVTEQYTVNFDKYYASTRSAYIAVIDTRGSGLRGSRNLFSLYKKLGTVEVEDQLTVIKYLLKKYNRIDPTKVGVWGWSYGGYVTGMMLATDIENIIKCGILVAPVTNWLLYDSMYTERYMGAPTEFDNYIGYFNSSLNRRVLGLRNKKFFLIHGTKDDNVHYQNSMFLAKMLEKNDILFRQLSYTDEDHSIRSMYPHLFHSIQQFLDDCFDINKNQ